MKKYNLFELDIDVYKLTSKLISVNQDVKKLANAQKLLKKSSLDLKAEIERKVMALFRLEKQNKQNTATYKKLEQEVARLMQVEKMAGAERKRAEAEVAVGLKKAQAEQRNYTNLVRDYTREEKSRINVIRKTNGSISQLTSALSHNKKLYRSLSKEQRENGKVGGDLLALIQKQDRELKKLNAGIGQHQANVGKYREAIKGLGKQLLAVTGLTAGLSMVMNFFRKSVGLVRDFELQIATLGGVARTTDEELKTLSNNARELGATTEYTAMQVAELQTEYARLGFSVQNIIDSTKPTLQGATAMGSALDETAKLTGATLNSFQKSTRDTANVIDVMAKSTQISALDFRQLQTALPIVGATAKNAGVSFERTSALLGVLSSNGIDASSSATALRNMFLELSNKGLTWEESMKRINKATDKNKAANELFGKRGATVAVTLATQSEKLRELEGELNNANGSAKELADKRLNTLDGSLKLLQSAWEGFILKLNDATNGGNLLSKAIRFLATNLEGIITAIASIVAGLVGYHAGVILAILYTKLFSKSQKGLTKSIKASTIATRVFNTVLKMNPIGAIVGLVVALGMALWKYRDRIFGVSKAQSTFNEIAKETKKQINSEISELDLLFSRLKSTNEGTQERKNLIEEINKKYGDYLPNLLNEKSTLEDIEKAYSAVSEAIKEEIRLKVIRKKAESLKEEELNSADKLEKVKNREKSIWIKHNGFLRGINALRQKSIQKNIKETAETFNKLVQELEKPPENKIKSEVLKMAEEQKRLAEEEEKQQERIKKYRENLTKIIKKQSDELDLYIAKHKKRNSTLEEGLKFEEAVYNKQLIIQKNRYKKGELSEVQYQTELIKLKQGFLQKQAELTSAHAEKELELYILQNQSKLESDKQLTADSVANEIDRLAKIREKREEQLQLDFNNDLISQTDFNIKKLELDSQFTEQTSALKEELKTQEKATEQEEWEATQELKAVRGETEFALRLEALDRERATKIENNEWDVVQEQIYAEKKKKIQQASTDFKLGLASQAFGNMATILGKETEAGKAMAIAQATIDALMSANKAYNSLAGIPIAGPALGAIAAAAAIASGFANVRKIKSVNASVPKAEKGAMINIGGKRHAEGGTKFYGEDGTVFEAEQGETMFILNRMASKMYAPYLSEINSKYGGVSFAKPSNYLASGGVVARSITKYDFDYNKLADLIGEKTGEQFVNLPNPVTYVEDIKGGMDKEKETNTLINI